MEKHPAYKRSGRRIIAVCLVALLSMMGLVACGADNSVVSVVKTENQSGPTESTVQTQTEPTMSLPTTITTKYCTLAIPETCSEAMKHWEVTEGMIAVEIFSMIHDEEELEIFRLYFGDESMGILMGYLLTEEGEISVSYTVNEPEAILVADEEKKMQYYTMMDGFSSVMDSIYTDSRFSETKHAEEVKNNSAALKYWTVDLPENVEWEESEQSGLYRADFYGTFRGKRMKLYTIGLGKMDGDYTIGTLQVNNETRPIYVKVYALEIDETWTEEEITAGYRMLETLNVVTDMIITTDGYSDDTSE